MTVWLTRHYCYVWKANPLSSNTHPRTLKNEEQILHCQSIAFHWAPALNPANSITKQHRWLQYVQAWAHEIFIFRTEKNWNFRTFFRTSESQKTRFFVILGAYNFGTFRAEAKITIQRHEVVYRVSSERKMIDLEWPLHAMLMLKSGTTLLSLCPVLLTHK